MSRSLPMISDEELVRGIPSALGASAPGLEDEPGFGALRTERGHLPLEAMDVRGRIDGLLARVTVRQTFVNALDEPLEAAYIFPLPDRAAVTRFRMEVAGRVIEGVLEERGQARAHYDQAVSEGRRAAIAEEDRPGVFNLRVGNLMPGERATVELILCGVLPYSDGEATFRFPLVVAPRYIPGIPLAGPSVGDGTATDTDSVPDASRISPPVHLPGFPNPVRLSLEVELYDGAAELDDLRCSLHAVRDEPRDGYRRVRLHPGERLNRDFILRFRLGGSHVRSTWTLHPDAVDGLGGTFALTIVPPAAAADAPARPRDLVFVLDRSGSMEGWKIVAARRALVRMIDTLDDSDRFAVLSFDTVVETPPGLPAGLSPGTDRHRFRAVGYLAGVNARGGTEMAEPLDQAVGLLSGSKGEGRDRILVLLTDGQVGNEDQVLRTLGSRLKGIRVFTLGIDRAVNEGFLRRLAERGGGSCELVESEDRLDEVMTSIHRRIGTPLLTDLSLASNDPAIEAGEVIPRRLPDLFAGSPLLILGRYLGRPAGTLAIRAADLAGRPWSQPVPAAARDNPAIAAAWARGQVRQLEDRYAAGDGDLSTLEKAIVAVSLKFHVLCRFTAYVAIDRSQAVNEGGAIHRITQPVEQPEGWNASLGASAASGMLGAVLSAAPGYTSDGSGGGGRRMLRSRLGDRRPSRSAPSPPSATPSGSARGYTSAEPAFEGFALCAPSAFEEPFSSRDEFGVGDPGAPPVPIEAGPYPDLPDRFELGARIGAGGMGSVLRAFDRQRNQIVIVKIIPVRGLDPEVLTGWRREVETLSSLAHPALVAVLELGVSDQSCWMIMPLVEGRTLLERLRSSGRMAPVEAAAIVAELAEAVHQAHEQGIVHGDISPSVVLLDDQGQPRLIGFGSSPRPRTGLTGRALIGNVAYASPERARGDTRERSPEDDVYALGVLLYEVLTGRPPFAGGSTIEVIRKVIQEAPVPPRRLVRSIPAALERICLKVMAKDPAGRYPMAGELAAALRAFPTPARRKGFWK